RFSVIIDNSPNDMEPAEGGRRGRTRRRAVLDDRALAWTRLVAGVAWEPTAAKTQGFAWCDRHLPRHSLSSMDTQSMRLRITSLQKPNVYCSNEVQDLTILVKRRPVNEQPSRNDSGRRPHPRQPRAQRQASKSPGGKVAEGPLGRHVGKRCGSWEDRR